MKHILVATDFSETASSALAQAAKLAAVSGAELTVLHVIYAEKLNETLLGLDAMEYLTRVISSPTGAGPYSSAQALDRLREAAQEKLAAAAAEIGEPRPKINTAVADGRPSDEVLKYAQEHGVDLIIVGTHGRGAIGKALLGSVADNIIRLSECPVMVVRN